MKVVIMYTYNLIILYFKICTLFKIEKSEEQGQAMEYSYATQAFIL